MSGPDDYRDFAAECIEMANRAKSSHEREALLVMARQWLAVANDEAANALDRDYHDASSLLIH